MRETILHSVADKTYFTQNSQNSQTLCLKNNSIYRLRFRWNPQTLSLATHDGWRGDNVLTPHGAPCNWCNSAHSSASVISVDRIGNSVISAQSA